MMKKGELCKKMWQIALEKTNKNVVGIISAPKMANFYLRKKSFFKICKEFCQGVWSI